MFSTSPVEEGERVEEEGKALRPSVHRKFLGKGQPFVDFKIVKVAAGQGGDGAITFFKSSRNPMGPPSGGNGARGGSVYIVACKEITSLNGVKNRYAAPMGGNGQGKQMHGAEGADVEIMVPLGTMVRKTHPDHLFDSFNLTTHGDRHLVARGGRGGHGNPHFVSSDIRGPAIAGRGQPGTTVYLQLELKTIADAGLVGLPNAGKSTFLAAVSNAHPRIAPYPFTTLNPYVGTIDFPDFYTMTVADIPGLIEGAHRNVGLGHRFLRHVEQSRMLVYVIDVAGPHPWRDLEILKTELETYQPGLTGKPSLVIANKADLGRVARENVARLREQTDAPIVPVSAMERKNITRATALMREMVEKIRKSEGGGEA
ncbi:P-loop containing nucleoside triphosphate hydrolase protein [Fimicolochytrium jonesii]|uniref:P-loop containing nucleoside triphosphate hydrolase protein n=1 Tax=Fimicolochytrium jonesii TaxID=1396493 RepID=UPI0022FE7316|nr:P-loop containing nucleoside triphosphate hydrolase protein [Fimicolochytrium jonesii]KAI8815753.1 P-loop containing nucleoside triphosphate hydrolase protein [Fimicolochytrium jonesii]